MEIIVEDANIIIDLINTGLMRYCPSIDIDFHTTDVVNAEIKDARRRQYLDALISNGMITIDSLNGNDNMKFNKVRTFLLLVSIF